MNWAELKSNPVFRGLIQPFESRHRSTFLLVAQFLVGFFYIPLVFLAPPQNTYGYAIYFFFFSFLLLSDYLRRKGQIKYSALMTISTLLFLPYVLVLNRQVQVFFPILLLSSLPILLSGMFLALRSQAVFSLLNFLLSLGISAWLQHDFTLEMFQSLGFLVFISVFSLLFSFVKSLDIAEINEQTRQLVHSRADFDYQIQAAEKKILEQQEFSWIVLESYPHPVYLVDVSNYSIKMANNAARNIFKQQASRALGDDSSICHYNLYARSEPCHGPDDTCPMEIVRKTLKPARVEATLPDDQGNIRVIERHGYPIFNSDGQVIQVIMLNIDVTESKESANRLQRTLTELANFKSALDHHAIVSITDEKGVITYVNDKFVETSGFTRDELIGRYHNIIKSGHHPKRYFQTMWDTINRGEIWQGEVKNRSKNGSYYWVNSTIVPFVDENKKPYQFVSVRTDITSQKEAEAILRRGKDAAEEANQAKSAFLANMSHEIRTPLNAILGMADLTLSTSLNKEQDDYVRMIKSSGENLLHLINEILDFSKIEAGKIELDIIPFELRRTVKSIVNMFMFMAKEKGLELRMQLDPKLPPIVMGDPHRLKQIITNLTGNAIKFTDKGHIIIAVDMLPTGSLGPDEYLVRFTVADSGIGIPAGKQASIFESFTQADNSITRKYGGTGLGTTISKQLVELMGGKIGLTSPAQIYPGLEGYPGSEFWFTIIMKKGELADSAFEGLDFSRQSMRALLVEADEEDLDLLEYAMTMVKFKPIRCHTGTEALKILEESAASGHPVHLVLAAKRLPDMDGFDLAARIRQRKGAVKIPFVLFSENIESYNKIRFNTSGIDACLAKPINKHELYDLLHDFQEKKVFIVSETSQISEQKEARKKDILVCEDNEINQTLIRVILQNGGYAVDIAADGAIGVQKLREKTYDLVIMDLQMPNMNGYEATEVIRKEINQQVPIIAVTANAFKDDIQKCYDVGMNAFIAKPYRKEELLSTIDEWLRKRPL